MQQMIFIADFIACSTCFGQYYAHHQELESITQMVAACGIWCCKEGKINLQVRQQLRFLALSVERFICCCRVCRVSWGLCMSVLGSIICCIQLVLYFHIITMMHGQNHLKLNLIKFHPVGTDLFLVDGQTDLHDEANAPKNGSQNVQREDVEWFKLAAVGVFLRL